ncbi:aminotransferase class V-fold PLP-dependent enzyme [Oceanicoccus sp. KOV_DT_Chl]|uniref:aminotransferase class V-fold PLP-dependent enzyme n=1 Tax=Oceanicoccus sp. KOV_DT_Chl TaxID=1904639 RepID=UPI000C7A6620|nr:aminotransferase class V-fold PLP-dependent enzyme [Oceanicoccus sp. KOV_DT_Chl]
MKEKLIQKVRSSVIGEKQLFETCFGLKPLIYADYTASGRALEFIEQYIRNHVLPFYANTHSESSYTGGHTGALREQARNIIRRSLNCGEDDRVIFCGSGATAAINKLIDILNLRLPADLAERHQLDRQIPADQRPVVFIGPYEHHSNELPWRESIAELIVIPLDNEGCLDIDVLESELEKNRERPVKIGSFSAASNVTGIKTDVNRVSALLHAYDAYVLWDYAAAAPYMGVDMNSTSAYGDSSKDAVFISTHKFIGGPATPGILVVKKHLLKNSVPAVPGGGTVLYVSPQAHRYIDDRERREEGGTPAIVESIRAGLVFKLQQDIGTDYIEARERQLIGRAFSRWEKYDNIEILGSTTAERLSIVSLRIKYQNKDLHYGFVVALLNDLFGVQARGGCSCAGPYGHALLNMDMAYSNALEKEILKGNMLLRPGWVRLNFNYFIDEDSFDYLVKAVALIAEHGWRLLPFYDFDTDGGTWRYQNKKVLVKNDLFSVDFLSTPSVNKDAGKSQVKLDEYLQLATQTLLGEHSAQRYEVPLTESAEKLRWFVLPQEIVFE